jgi:hypothetical protein
LKGNVASPTAAISAAAINARFEIDDVLRVNQARTAGMQTATAQPISTIAIRPTPVLKRNVSTVAALTEKNPVSAAAAAAPTAPSPVCNGSDKGGHRRL